MSLMAGKEREALLVLFKDFVTHYNAHSLSGRIGITSRGALKLLKRLKEENILIGRRLGKAQFYKVNLGDERASRLLSLLLLEEAREKASRWIAELRPLFQHANIVILFGSMVRSPRNARDVDILAVFPESEENQVNKVIEERENVSARAIHLIKQSPEDLRKNLRKGDKVLLDIVGHGIVLHGQDALTEVLSEVTRLP